MNSFFMPPEWALHDSTWLAWPYDTITFPNHRLKQVEIIFAELIYQLHHYEMIHLIVLDLRMKKQVELKLASRGIVLKKIIFHCLEYADVWIRDYGPTFLINKEKTQTAWIKWKYNAYGEKFPDLLKDNEVGYQLMDYLQPPQIEPDIIVEGGAIEVNGKGDVLTTKECLLNNNRNPQFTQLQIESRLKNYLGASQIIWLNQGLINDHTDGHIDEIARFFNPYTIAYAYDKNFKNPNFERLHENFTILKQAQCQTGKPFNLIPLPLPKLTYDTGELAPASYLNFYMANQIILVPQFGDPNDEEALNIIRSACPKHHVIGVDSQHLIYGGGSLHCITQQQPQIL